MKTVKLFIIFFLLATPIFASSEVFVYDDFSYGKHAKGIKHKSKNIKKIHTIPFHFALWYILCQETTTKFVDDQLYNSTYKEVKQKVQI